MTSVNSSAKVNKILTAIVTPFFLAGGLFLWWLYLDGLNISLRATYLWKEVSVTNNEAEIVKTLSTQNSTYGLPRTNTLTALSGNFSYTYNGSAYTCDRWTAIRGSSNMDNALKKSILEKAEDNILTARVNPDNPNEAIIDPTFPPGSGALIGFLAPTFSLLGLAWIFTFLGRFGILLTKLYFIFSAAATGTAAWLAFIHTGFSISLTLMALTCALWLFLAVQKHKT